jgi:hypothetical protein
MAYYNITDTYYTVPVTYDQDVIFGSGYQKYTGTNCYVTGETDEFITSGTPTEQGIRGWYTPVTYDRGTTSAITGITGDYIGTQGIYNIMETGISYRLASTDFWYSNPEEVKKLAQKEKLKNNLVIHIKSRADLLWSVPDNEKVAMETLREVISETEFRKYLKYGFILVKGQSGDTYQIFRNRSHTKIWRAGKIVEEVCVRISETGIPPTDNVIAFRTIIQSNEEDFKKLGNVYKMGNRTWADVGIVDQVVVTNIAA